MILFYSFLILFASGCGRFTNLNPNKQHNDKISVPDNPDTNKNNFNLIQQSKLSTSYISTFLVWDENASSKTMESIIDNTLLRRKVGLQFATYIEQHITPTLKQKETLTAQQNSLKTAETKWRLSNTDGTQAMSNTAANWFENKLAKLISDGIITPAIKSNAQVLFAEYCESKIWKFALSKLAMQSYSQRPTPFAMCENYYKNSPSKFFSSTQCENSDSPKSYLDCIWLDGVMKTTRYDTKLNSRCKSQNFATGKEALKHWYKSGYLKKILAASQDNTNKYYRKAKSILKKISSGRSFSSSEARKFSQLKLCKSAFKNNVKTKVSISDYTINEIIAIPTEHNYEQKLMFIPTTSTKQAKLNYTHLAQPIDLMSKVSSSELSSVNNYVFNQSNKINLNIDNKIFKTAKSNKDLRSIFNAQAKWSRSNEVNTINYKLNKLKTSIENKFKKLDQISKSYFDYTNKNVNILAKDNTARVVLPFDIDLKQNKEQVELTLNFNGNKIAKACINKATSTSATCSPTTVTNILNATIKQDPESKVFTFKVKIKDPADFGLKEIEKLPTTSYYSDIDPDKITNTTLILDVEFATLNANYNFFTGTLKIVDETDINKPVTLITGSATGNNYSQLIPKLD